MNKEKTIKEKIEQSAVAAMGISAILALLTVIGTVGNIVEAATCGFPKGIADSVGNTAESALLCVVSIISMLLFAKISKDGTPFSSKIVKLLRSAGIIMLINGFVPPAARGITLTVLGETPEFAKNSTSVFFGAILMILALIFSYGTMLQNEADDTV